MKDVHLIIEKNQDGLWGRLKEYPGVFTYGESLTDIQNNAREALELYLEDDDEPLPDFNFILLMDLEHFFQVNDFINISKLAQRTGMNTSLLRQYARGIKYPSLNQVDRIEQAIKQIGRELLKTQLLDSSTI